MEQNIPNNSVAVVARGDINLSEFCSMLSKFGIETKNDETSRLDIILVDDYLHPDILEIQKKNNAIKRPWILIKPNGYQIWLGPIFNTLENVGCYLCLKKRLELNQIEKTIITLKKDLQRPPSLSVAKLPLTFNIASTLAAIEIKRYLQKPEDHQLNEKILTLDTLKWKIRYHDLLVEEDCPNCEKLFISHQQRPVQFLNLMEEEDHKQKIDKIYRHISPITGIISKIKHRKLPGSHLYETVSCNQLSHDHKVLHLQECNPYMLTGGKGFSRSKAKLTAVSEALERYSGNFKGNEVKIVDSLRGLGSKAIHPNHCMLFSKTQYQQREMINNKGNSFNQIPLPFNEDEKIEWSPVYSFTQNREYYLPTQFLYYEYHSHPLKLSHSPRYCRHDSNGNAAHFNYTSAILHGLFELIERDAVALWWYNRLNKPQVSIEAIKDKAINSFIKKHKSLDRELWILDLTTDLGIPVFAATSCRKKEESNIIFGFGCHLDPKIAIKKALLEMNQVFLMANMIHTKEEEILHNEIREWFKFANLKNQSYLKPNGQFRETSDSHLTDKIEMLKFCLDHLKNNGFNVLFLDQTKPHLTLKVVKVIIPGLRHFWPRFAPGRLYDVPVQMGWLPVALNESELNPIDFFL